MGVAVFPASLGGGVKSIQRGSAASATTITISSVDTSKSFVRTFSNASSGNVSGNRSNGISDNNDSWTGSFNFGTSFASGSYGAYLSSSTELITSGPCRWEVVEFN